jgi:hypothetical protein
MMSLLGKLLLSISLIVGALSAATSYIAPLDAPDEQLLGLHLAANIPGVGNADAEITAEMLVQLRGYPAYVPGVSATPPAEGTSAPSAGATALNNPRGEERPLREVPVREFSFRRWTGKYYFIAALIGLLVSAGMLRAASRAAAEAPKTGDVIGPEEALERMVQVVDTLRIDVAAETDETRMLHMIVDQLDEVHKTLSPAFVDGRDILKARLGIGGYARLMDQFSFAERQLNRAWSAAADHVFDEALECLETGEAYLKDTAAALASMTANNA